MVKIADITKGPLAALSVEPVVGSRYPGGFAAPVLGRERRRLGDLFGLTGFGVNLTRIPPGEMSSQRHHHSKEDEFIYVLDGVLTLITDDGEVEIRAGMVAGFAAGNGNGHHLINRTDRSASYLEIGDRVPGDVADYPDIDLRADWQDGDRVFVRKDGTFYESQQRQTKNDT